MEQNKTRQLLAQINRMQKAVLDKQKFQCEVDCPECEGKGQVTEKEGLNLDFIPCPACKTEGRLVFKGLGEFYVASEFYRKQSEDEAVRKEAEAKAELERQKKDEN